MGEIKAKPYLKSISLAKPESDKADCYPFNIPSISSIESLSFHADVTFFVGENGSGKSTLLEAIASVMELSPQGGTKNFSIADTSGLSVLKDYLRPKRSFLRPRDRFFLRAESLFNVGTYLEESAEEYGEALVYARYGGKSIHHRSHGESFLSLLNDSFGGKGLYILDEPEAALSPTRQLAALERIHELVLDQSQFIIATHSPILLSYPRAFIYMFDEHGCSRVNYEDTEHYKVTRKFLDGYRDFNEKFEDHQDSGAEFKNLTIDSLFDEQ